MCGIAGVVSLLPGKPVSPKAIGRMTASMIHRGPDGEGIWISPDRSVGLGHRRLAIVDLSDAGRQPMTNSDASVVVTFNGEIYNFPELRLELEAKGYHFRSHADTEVLVYLYEQMGEAMVDRLDGDFAFGIVDLRRRELFLARDRAGVKPLYYTIAGDKLLFASEIKAILQYGDVAREIDEESLYHYLTYLVVPAPRTLFRSVYKLPIASTLSLRLGDRSSLAVRSYWKPFPGQYAVDLQNLDEQLDDLFSKSVRKRLMSDVPVGALFSGGVDSTLNAASFQKLIGSSKVRTFYVGMTGAPSFESETEWARAMAKKLDTEHHEIIITERDLLDAAVKVIQHQDEPLSDPVCVPLYFVSRLAKETGTTVLHAGEGADEIFCGYDNYRRFLRHYDWLWQPISLLPSAMSRIGSRLLRRSSKPIHRKVADVLRRRGLGQELFMSGAVAYYEDEKDSILARGFSERHRSIDSFDVVAPLYREIDEECPDATFLQRLTYLEMNLRLPELLLMRVDKMTMANSVEVRVPFLDRDLVDFALSVPDEYKIRDGVSKEPVKRLAAREVGRDAVYRKKTGFGVPIHQWFRSDLGRDMRALIEEDRQEISEFFDLDTLRADLRSGPETINRAFQLWVVYGFLQWRRAFLAPVGAHTE